MKTIRKVIYFMYVMNNYSFYENFIIIDVTKNYFRIVEFRYNYNLWS